MDFLADYIRIKSWRAVYVDNNNKTLTLIVMKNLAPFFNPFSVVYLYLANHPPIRLFIDTITPIGLELSITFTFTENVVIYEALIIYFLIERKSIMYTSTIAAEVNNFVNEAESGISLQSYLEGIYSLKKSASAVYLRNPFIITERILASSTSSVAIGTYTYNLTKRFAFIKVFVLGSSSIFSSFIVNLQYSSDSGTTWYSLRTFTARMSSQAPTTVLLSSQSYFNINARDYNNYLFRVSITLNQATAAGGSVISYYVSEYYLPMQNTKFEITVPRE